MRKRRKELEKEEQKEKVEDKERLVRVVVEEEQE